MLHTCFVAKMTMLAHLQRTRASFGLPNIGRALLRTFDLLRLAGSILVARLAANLSTIPLVHVESSYSIHVTI